MVVFFGQSYFWLFGSPKNLAYKLWAGYAWGLVADNTPFPWVETHGHIFIPNLNPRPFLHSKLKPMAIS
jgi:hypothetical protein